MSGSDTSTTDGSGDAPRSLIFSADGIHTTCPSGIKKVAVLP